MANTFILGGSPLGLIGVESRPTRTGTSTFNGGESRNINVISYNSGKKQGTNLKDQSGNNIDERVSLFTGGSIPNFWGNLGKNSTDQDTIGTDSSYNGIDRSLLHSNDVYDTSLLNIIEQLSQSPKAALRPQDFAYLKKLGVYPNNRLMVARRFPTPMKDNIMDSSGSGVSPLSVLISWKPEDQDFLDFSFGEEWEDAEADFSNLLSSFGENFGMKGLGDMGGAGGIGVPLPGYTESLQRKFLAKLGILKDADDDTLLPTGNPNIIKQARRRKLIRYGDSGSGLKATINIKMTVEYEQKFLSGIDPTVAWMDILNNALVFGTQNSDNWGLSSEFASKIKSWTGPNAVDSILSDIVSVLQDSLNSIKEKIQKAVDKFSGEKPKITEEQGTDLWAKAKATMSENLDNINKLAGDMILSTIRKYQIQAMGIARALSGLPSTPWHITLGNPMRPIFVSGDMLVESVNVKLGPTLSFNDLPTNITIDFTMSNARSLGLQELIAKFNSGYLRTVNVRKDFVVGNSIRNGSIYYTPLGEVKTEPIIGDETHGSSEKKKSDNVSPGITASNTEDEAATENTPLWPNVRQNYGSYI